MNLDRMLTRGLAATAVSTLALTGTTVISPLSHAADPVVIRLISPLDHVVATRLDGSGWEGEVRLAAQGPDGGGFDFQVNADPRASVDDPDWMTIGTGSMSGGVYVSTSWSPTEDTPALVGRRVAIRAVAYDLDQVPTYSAAQEVFIAPPDADAHSVHVESFSGGYFVQPYASTARTASLVGIAGTTSAADGAVSLEEWRPAAGAYRALTNAAVSPADLKGHRGTQNIEVAGGRFQAVLPLNAFDAAEGHGVAVRAKRDTEDVPVAIIHRQRVARIDYRDTVTTSAGTSVQLVVVDDRGDEVAGAEVRTGDGQLLGYTGGDGAVTVTQPKQTTHTYYVNTDDGDAYEPDRDFSVTYTSPDFTREATKVVAVLTDGSAFDAREYTAGDIALQVVDQDGRPFAGARQVQYRLYPNGATPPSVTTATTDVTGRLVLPFDPSRSAGSWHLEHALPAGFATVRWDRFVSGRAALTLTPGRGQAASGGELTYSGRLAVAGQPLPGRTVDLTYGRGSELVPGSGPDAGILTEGERRLAATVMTRADGTFTATVDDPQERGNPTEQGGRLRAVARTSGATAVATSQFGAGKGTVRPALRGASRGRSDRLVVRTSAVVAGERVRILVKAGRKWRTVRTARLDRKGGAIVAVKDRNGGKVTTYLAQLMPSTRVAGSRSASERVR